MKPQLRLALASCTHTTTINQPSEISFHAALAPSPSATIEACGDDSSPPTDQALSLSGLYLLQVPSSLCPQVALVRYITMPVA